MSNRYDVAIVGAGILGLAHAYVCQKRGLRAIVVERSPRALGASIRNFGMIWPVGQPLGEMRDMALRSRELWLEVLNESGIWHRKCGSLHLAYHPDEMAVLSEFVSLAPGAAAMISASEALERSPVIRFDELLGGMWSESELCVNPRSVVASLPEYLSQKGVEFRFGFAVSGVERGCLVSWNQEIHADRILLCTGDDFETLFPGFFASTGMVRCKLQMLKARPKSVGYKIGTHLCAGLTLSHYGNFRVCKSLPLAVERFEREFPRQMHHGVHLLVSQHENGELTIGDSHEYGSSPDPFLLEEVDRLILDYLDRFLPVKDFAVTERWHGVYAKHPEKSYVIEEVLPEVYVVTGVGGAGMTLSFGLADKVCARFL